MISCHESTLIHEPLHSYHLIMRDCNVIIIEMESWLLWFIAVDYIRYEIAVWN